MNKKDRAIIIEKILGSLYKDPKPPLDFSNPFTLLIAVLLSAQCTDERVNIVTKKLFKEAKTPKKMAALGQDKIFSYIKTCGLAPKKSKAILETSNILVKKFNSKVPQSIEELVTLPGVGHKTASVVLNQAFGQASFAVDTHIHRLAQRWKLTNGKNVTQTERDLKKLFPKEKWGDLHLQIIFYGREFCQARKCYGLECNLCKTLFPNRNSKVITNKP
jgi:endonuclease-3|tara:strand:- start:731 stop:1384 length:654 start_codon:yes stop_codon:yes gene_type:complete